MLFCILVILLVVGIVLIRVSDSYNVDFACGCGILLTVASTIALFVCITILLASHIGIDGTIARYNVRYESLTYQYENDVYDNDNDIGKRELISDIQAWNEDLADRKAKQNDFWIGIFIPDIYDQFEFIELT